MDKQHYEDGLKLKSLLDDGVFDRLSERVKKHISEKLFKTPDNHSNTREQCYQQHKAVDMVIKEINGTVNDYNFVNAKVGE